VELNPNRQEALRALAGVAIENGQFMEAFAAASRAVELDPSDPAAHRLLVQAVARLYGPDKAISVMQARMDETSDPAPQVGLAYAYLLKGAPDRSLAVLAESVETRKTEAEAAYVRGLAKDALGLHEEAVTELSRAAAGEKAPADYHASLAATLALAGRPEDALWEYSLLLGDPASEARGIDGIRRLLAARAVAPTAVCEALRRVGMERGPGRALLALLGDLLSQGAPADTVMALNDIRDVWPNSEPAASALADAYQATGQPEEEARVLVRLVDMRPAEVSYQLRLARAHERAHAPSRAADTYAMVLAFDPNNQEAAAALERLLAEERHPSPPGSPPASPQHELTPPPSSTLIGAR